MAKASWKTLNDEWDEQFVERLKNGNWIHRVNHMERDGSGRWETTTTHLSEEEAATLLINAGVDLTEAGLEEYDVDDR